MADQSITETHPEYDKVKPDWTIVADGYAGQREVKKKGSIYLPPTGGQVALGLGTDGAGNKKDGQVLYDAYLARANYPAIVKDTANALVGVLNQEPPVIEVPTALEDILENATDQGEPLTALLRRIQLSQMLWGRRGLLVDVDANRDFPYLVDFNPLQVINWDDEQPDPEQAERALTMVVTDETRYVRERFTWSEEEKFRAMELIDGTFTVSIRDAGVELPAITPNIQGTTLDFIPFTFIGATDLVPQPGDIPLLGLANLALTIYRGDADYRQALFMQGQDTLVIIGEDVDPEDEDSKVIVGAGAMINLPNENADAKFIGVDGQGLSEMREAQDADFMRAAEYGLQMMSGKGAEAAETLKIRVAARTADLVSIAQTSAAGLQQALQHAATWIGADPEECRVEANTDFIQEAMPAAELLGYMNAKSRGAPLSLKSIHGLMRKGDVTQLTYEEEQEELDGEPEPDDRTLLGEEDEQPGNQPPGNEDQDEDEDE